jgi:diguanylate cyclase (GGDEF)-like protein
MDERHKWEHAANGASNAIFIIDRAAMRFIYCNETARRLSRRTRTPLLRARPWNVFFTLRRELEAIYDRLIIGDGIPERVEIRWAGHDKRTRWIEIQHHAQKREDRWQIVAVARDVTEDKASQADLKRLTRLYSVVSGVNALVLRAQDRNDLYRAACRVAVEQGEFMSAWIGILPPSEEHIVPVASAGLDDRALATIKEVFLSEAGALDKETLAARSMRARMPVISNDVQNDQATVFSKEYVEAGVRALAVFPLVIANRAVGILALRSNRQEFFDDQGVRLLTEVADNIAYAIDHIERQELLDYRAYYHELTGLANRRLFLDRVAQYVRVAADTEGQVALFFIDLERFRSVNQSLGRAAGDSLLKQVAQWLADNVENINDLAHLGGDQFAIIVPRAGNEDYLIRQVEDTIRAFLAHSFSLNGRDYRIAAKIGAALYPDDGGDADTLLQHAEAALKKAKAGGDRYLFYALKMSETIAGTLDLESQLRQALEREEFVLYYQPKFNAASGLLAGAEALIRWNSPKMGLVPPGRFIPVLERTGLIHEVGAWTLNTAAREYLRWTDAGLPAVPIAVNVSPLQLRNRQFVKEVVSAANIDSRAARGLELEITESVVMENVEYSIATLLAIRAAGVCIAIDDFGTGFSSLSQLSRLPIDALKIDRMFVVDMARGANALTLVTAIINLAHALKMKVIAEGVETEAQLRLLRSLRCDEIQGFLFSEPVPRHVFEERYLACHQNHGAADVAQHDP